MPQRFLDSFLELVSTSQSAWLLLLAALARISVRGTPRPGEARARASLGVALFIIHLLNVIAASAVRAMRHDGFHDLGIVASLLGTLAWVFLGGVVVFEGFVRRLWPATPRILLDVVTSAVALVALMRTSSRLGLDISGVIATSAVLTAVIGLSLQDTLGNVLGGLAIQLDQSFRVGDWVRVGDVTGRVSEIRWRYTALETRNWETVIIPNNLVAKQQVIVLGRRQGEPVQWRRWVKFQVAYDTAPPNVIETVEVALRGRTIPNVASQPPANCIAFEFGDSAVTYAVRYLLTDLAFDDPTDSAVRTTVYFALKRAGISFSIPAQAVHVSEDEHRHAQQRSADLTKRREALARIDLFRGLSDAERDELAERLHPAPFAKGEVLTRIGADAHFLYTIVKGDVSVRIGTGSDEREVNHLGPGDFFGEMALLTGEKRRANVVATSDVECYRLDAEAFRQLLVRRSDIAEQVATVLAERRVVLDEATSELDANTRSSMVMQHRDDFLGKMRAFFELD